MVYCWLLDTICGRTSIGSNNRTFSIEFISGVTTSADGDKIFRDDINLIDGAWKWCCQPIKCITVPGGSVEFKITAVANNLTFNYFNPCLQYISTSVGMTDGDVMNAARSYKGGWSPTASTGQVGILDHQQFHGNHLFPAFTVATLPASPTAGMQYYITDCNTATSGRRRLRDGSNKVMVWYNGTNWTVMGK